MRIPKLHNIKAQFRYVSDRLHHGLKRIPQFFKEGHHRKPRFWVIVIVILGIFLLLRSCSVHFSHHPRPSLPVVTAMTTSSDVPVYLEALGAVTPVYSVTVKTQLNGLLMQVAYKEGQMVKTGDLLAVIDPRPYEAQLIQYEGQLERDRATLANDRLNLKRYQVLWPQNSVSKQTLDTQVALVQQDEGTVQLDEGLVQGVKVNLMYTRITSPINGRVGLRLVDPGNFVQTSDTTGIAVVNMLDPITVIFSLAEDSIPDVMEQLNAGKTLKVLAYNRDQQTLLATGTLLTIDNQINPSTGTVNLRAQFQNSHNTLFPSQFVNVKLLVKTLQHATIVPTAAIQHTTDSSFVYVVNSDNTVKVTPVKASVTINANTVVTGVSPGQSVVIEGADKLVDGAVVTVPDTTSAPQLAMKTQVLSHRRHMT